MAIRTLGGGPTGRRIAANLAELRESRHLSQPQLAVRVQQAGGQLTATLVSKTENGDRRVDVDDLVALAIALGVSPNRLLLTADADGEVELTPTLIVHAADAWRWAAGERPLDWPPPDREPDLRAEAESRTAFVRENRPDAGDFSLDYGILIGARGYAVHSILGNLMAALERGLKPDALHQLVDTAVIVRNGGSSETKQPVEPAVVTVAAQQPVVAAIVTSPLGVLVGRRNDGKPPWTFIAGEVEPGERPEDAAVREVKEETGLLVRAGALIGERVHPKTGRTMIYMAAMPTHGTDVFVGDEDELAEVRWVSLAEADEMLPGMYEPVRDYLRRQLASS